MERIIYPEGYAEEIGQTLTTLIKCREVYLHALYDACLTGYHDFEEEKKQINLEWEHLFVGSLNHLEQELVRQHQEKTELQERVVETA